MELYDKGTTGHTGQMAMFASADSPTPVVPVPKDLENAGYLIDGQFHRHEMYGSLRSGGPVSFFSRECIGLVAAVFSSVFSFAGFQPVLKPLLTAQLHATKQQSLAIQRLVEIPIVFTFFFGLLTDCYPILGLRRKAYMIVGLVMHAGGMLAIAAISATSHPSGTDRASNIVVALLMISVTCTSIGCMLTYLVTHTRVIELSQREPLCERGLIQGTYLIFRRICKFSGALFVFLTIGTNPAVVKGDLVVWMVLVAAISAAPLPLIMWYWDEDTYSLSSTVKMRASILWRIVQQKAMWRTLVFIACFTFFLGIKFADPANVVRNWAGAAKDNVFVTTALLEVVVMLTILVWRTFCINSRWRRFYSWCPIFTITPQVLLAALVCFDVARNRYLYRALTLTSNIGDSIATLIIVAPLVEIVQEGSEGATVGLVISLQKLIGLFVTTNTANVFSGDIFYKVKDVKADGPDVRWMVFVALMINYFINSFSATGLIFLPCQKLDAQQLRMFGGFTKTASSTITAVSVVFVVYSIVINSMAFIPSMACLHIAGGAGCA